MKPSFLIHLFAAIVVTLVQACQHHDKEQPATDPLFALLPVSKTGIDFNNVLTEGLNTNVLMYEYFYNGGGVATGDVNGDGLEDIYFTGNMTDNKLYLNKGNMQFRDVTSAAGVAGRSGPWKTGIAMADVNGDDKLDLYVCYSGNGRGERRENQLFINEGPDANGTPHFREQAHQYGLADSSHSTQSVFFDYDKDGDLDMLLINHNIFRYTHLDDRSIQELSKKTDLMSGVRLFQNEQGKFKDITTAAGLKSTVLSHGLGAGVSDLNSDGWPDIYLSNDYLEPDYLYLNKGNGTFNDRLSASVGHTSFYSMGNDIADINNDGYPDLLTLDMLPEDNRRQKLLAAPDNYEAFNMLVKAGFHYQYMRNMLQVNNGEGAFSEVGQLSGISSTDWSWAPLFADYDNDGWKDLFITNGYVRDYTNMDFLKYMGDFLQNGAVMRKDLLQLVQKMPASNVVNYGFRNNGDLTFTKMSSQWGFKEPSNSNGAAYSDLDNDGDLDLVMNNINQPAFVYENKSNKQENFNYLKIKLEGASHNTQGIGAKVLLYGGGKMQYLEQMPSRGFQSSVSPILHYGLGKDKIIDSLQVIWASGKVQTLTNVQANQLIKLQEKEAANLYQFAKTPAPIYKESKAPFAYHDAPSNINDFKRQPLLINPLSFSGPCLVKGDVNGDGLEDLYAGGGNGQAAMLYLQRQGGKFVQKVVAAFEADKQREDADALFFDCNGDGLQDLYVVSGGYHNYTPEDVLLQDRLYLGDGKGNFAKATDALPEMNVSKSCVRETDVNGDGFLDLFVGGRVIPGRYPETPQSYLLINDGKGHFNDKTSSIAPSLQKTGMVTDAAWLDLNGDNKKDLVVIGEWMPVTVYVNANGKLENKTSKYFDKVYRGWWNKLLTGDFNHDGKTDLVIGNMGLNTLCKATDAEPAELYFKDFDDNGSVDPILCFYMQGKSYPYVFRDELLDQMSTMRTRFTDYKSYADATIKDIFSDAELRDAGHLKANYLKTAYFEGGTNGKFQERALPLQVQFSPVFTITALDYDKDGNEDLLFCGNINQARLRFGKSDANNGVLLKGNGKGAFQYITQPQSGFHLSGDVRCVVNITGTLLFGINQNELKAYTTK